MGGFEEVLTRRARVKVPSTSKRQIVLAIGRLSSGGYASAILKV